MQSSTFVGKNIYVDIDETICFYRGRRDYSLAEPCHSNIAKINNLYLAGNIITYWTARGTVTGIDWHDLTAQQLQRWNCFYHQLIVGEKPAYDILICDKTMRIEEL